MLEAISVPALLASPRYCWAWTGTHWQRPEIVALKALCEFGAPLEKSADALGRSPTSIAHRARDTGLALPYEWRDAITIRRSSKPRAPKAAPLQYPFIVNVRGEHADLLAVNSLVSRDLPDHIRADVCQEIMLAIWQKQVTLDELRCDRRLVQSFVRGFRKANLEGGGFAMSLDVPMHDGRSWYDVLPDPSTVESGEKDHANHEPRWHEAWAD